MSFLSNKTWLAVLKAFVIIISLLLAWKGRGLLLNSDFPQSAINTLVLLIIASVLWITGVIPPFAVSMLVIGYAVFFIDDLNAITTSKNWQSYIATWSSPIIWILLGGFFLSIALNNVKLDERFSLFLLKLFGSNSFLLLAVLMMLSWFFSIFLSNTATTALLVSVLYPFSNSSKHHTRFLKATYIGLAASASIGGMASVIGSPANLLVNESLAINGLSLSFYQWLKIGLPVSLFFNILAFLFVWYWFKPKVESFEMFLTNNEFEPINARQWFVIIVILLTAFLWIFNDLIGLPIVAVSFIPIVLFSVSGIVGQEHLKSISWDTLLLVAGSLTLGLVVSDSGMAEYIQSKLNALSLSPLILIIILCYMAILLSNIMSNTATVALLITLTGALPAQYLVQANLAICFTAAAAVLLPVSTPPNAIVLSTGYIKQGHFKPLGILLILIAPVLIPLFLWIYL